MAKFQESLDPSWGIAFQLVMFFPQVRCKRRRCPRINQSWLVVWNMNCIFPFSWEFHDPNWRSPSFFRGAGQRPTMPTIEKSPFFMVNPLFRLGHGFNSFFCKHLPGRVATVAPSVARLRQDHVLAVSYLSAPPEDWWSWKKNSPVDALLLRACSSSSDFERGINMYKPILVVRNYI